MISMLLAVVIFGDNFGTTKGEKDVLEPYSQG